MGPMVTNPADLPAFLHPFARPAATRDDFLEIVSAAGAEVVAADGRHYIDALASLWFCNVGHGRAEIADAVAAQIRRLDCFHTFDRFTNPVADALARRLAELAPMPDARVFLTSGGSEAVDTAVKLVRLAQARAGHPERTVVVSRRPSYHGVTYAAMSATGLPANREGFAPLVPDVVQVPYDDLEALDALPEAAEGRIAAVLAEPVIGAGGVYPAPPGYLAGLRARCDSWGAYLVLDEVVCGFGRLGAWWGASHYGVQPDLVTFAKGVSSGYLPIGGVLVGSAVRAPLEADRDFVLRHGYTFSGHPATAAAALTNLDLLVHDRLSERAEVIARRLGAGLRALVDDRTVVEARGTMGIWALGFGSHIDAVAVRNALLERGVIARPLGSSTLAYCPPLVITDEQLDACVERTGAAVAEVAANT